MNDPSRTHHDAQNCAPALARPGRGWRGPAALLTGVAGIALLLAAESLQASTIFDVTLHVPGVDKVAHVAQYAIVFLIVWWLVGPLAPRRAPRLAAAAAIAFLLGMADEVFQRAVATRSFEVADLAANGVGVLLGIGLGPVLPGRRLARGTVAVALCGLVALAAQSYIGLRHFNRGVLYTRAGDLPRALDQYRLALRDGLDTPTFYNELAWIEVESGVGDVEAAVAYSSWALHADPGNPDVLDTHGWALHSAGRSREALPFLERALAGKPGMFCIHYHLGEVYRALGDQARAERHLREQIRSFPGGSEARRAAASLQRPGEFVRAAPPTAPAGP